MATSLQLLILIVVASMMTEMIAGLTGCENLVEHEECGKDGNKIKRCRKAPPHCEGDACHLVCVPDVTACSSNPCLNGGTCILDTNGGYSCYCSEGFGGTNCEMAVSSACSPNPCLNTGTCVPEKNGGFWCNCIPGFQGKKCEIAW